MNLSSDTACTTPPLPPPMLPFVIVTRDIDDKARTHSLSSSPVPSSRALVKSDKVGDRECD